MSSRPSPLPNRVTPEGEIIAHKARGAWMGNRGGRIHENWRITRFQGSNRWIICRLSFKGRRRQVMGESYTELFFADEATALAAGHRPCWECRRGDALAFARFWAEGQGRDAAKADEIDAVLNRERRAPGPHISAGELAPGAMVAAGGRAFLWAGSRFWRWTPEGYEDAEAEGALRLLTPPSTLAALTAGYRAQTAPLDAPALRG